jgi:AcrR family transcriptional regulator
LTEEPTPAPRPSLRDENRERTRARVIDAVVEIALLRGGLVDPEVFTFALVAEIAGVSERTVYRLFPTKRDLTRAYIESGAMGLGREIPESVDEYAAALRELGEEWAKRYPGRVQAPVSPGWTPEDNPEATEDRRQRDDRMIEALDELIPADLPPRQRLALVAAVHSATSMHTLTYAAGRWGLTLQEGALAHAWAFDVFIDALRNQEITPWEIKDETET